MARAAGELGFDLRQAGERAAEVCRDRAATPGRSSRGRAVAACRRFAAAIREVALQVLASATSSATASRRALMSATFVSGAASQSASRRAPIDVTVRSSVPSSEPSRRPSRIVATSSRLRRVAGSIARRSSHGVRAQAIDVRERRLLRFGQIIEHCAGGAEGGHIGRFFRLGVEAEAFERVGAEVFGQRFEGGGAAKCPGGAASDCFATIQSTGGGLKRRRQSVAQRERCGRVGRQLDRRRTRPHRNGRSRRRPRRGRP